MIKETLLRTVRFTRDNVPAEAADDVARAMEQHAYGDDHGATTRIVRKSTWESPRGDGLTYQLTIEVWSFEEV